MSELPSSAPVVVVVIGASLPELQEHGHDQEVQEAEDDVDVEKVDVEVTVEDQLDNPKAGNGRETKHS